MLKIYDLGEGFIGFIVFREYRIQGLGMEAYVQQS